MKKTAMILGAVLFLITATVKAQVEPKQDSLKQQQQLTTGITSATNANDKWNNWSPDKYKMLPMPEPLTTEKIFPVLGHYNVTAKTTSTAAAPAKDESASATTETSSSGASSEVTIALDDNNKGIVWVEGLPQGKIKAYLRKSPSTYMIPTQKTVENKDLSEGVMIYDKDANTLDVCIGCKYNNEDPASAFTAPQPVAEEQPVAKTTTKHKKGTAKAKAKVKPVKTWMYSGSKTS